MALLGMIRNQFQQAPFAGQPRVEPPSLPPFLQQFAPQTAPTSAPAATGGMPTGQVPGGNYNPTPPPMPAVPPMGAPTGPIIPGQSGGGDSGHTVKINIGSTGAPASTGQGTAGNNTPGLPPLSTLIPGLPNWLATMGTPLPPPPRPAVPVPGVPASVPDYSLPREL